VCVCGVVWCVCVVCDQRSIINLFGDRSCCLLNVHLRTGHSGGGDECAVLGADQIQVGFGNIGTILGSLQFALETTDTGGGLLGEALLLGQLASVDVDLGSGLVQRILQQNDILLILLTLYDHLLDGTLLLAQDLDGLGMTTLLLLQLQFQITNACLQFADDALATGNSVQLHFLQANGQVLHRSYAAPSYGSVGDYVKNAETAEAQAAALTNSAGSAASSAKLDGTDWYALNRYGWEQGKPLLVKPYGPLDKLYAAALPPRSFVAEIDPGGFFSYSLINSMAYLKLISYIILVFKRNNYGGAYGEKTITLNTGSKLAVSAV